ncbi:hypothetical protein WH47_05991, partial [Habropoda laboriosa]
WLPRSPDLNHLDLFLWDFLKYKVYPHPLNSVEDVKEQITVNCKAMTKDQFNSVMKTIKKRCTKCLDCNGKAFEHLL